MIAQAVLQLLVLKILNLPVSVVGRTFILSVQRVLPLDALLLHAHNAQHHILAVLQGKETYTIFYSMNCHEHMFDGRSALCSRF